MICELKESLKRLQLYQFNAGRRTLASGGCKRKELLPLLELSQEVEVFTKHFTDLLLKLSRWIVWLFLRRVSSMNGWPVSRWIFFVSKDRNIKNRFDWHCGRVVAVAWQKKTAFTLAHRVYYACSTRTCCDKGKYWFDSNFRLTVSGF